MHRNPVFAALLLLAYSFVPVPTLQAQDNCAALVILEAPAGNGLRGAFAEIIVGEDTTEIFPGGQNLFIQEVVSSGQDSLEIILDPGTQGAENLSSVRVSVVFPDGRDTSILAVVFPRRSILQDVGLDCNLSCQSVFPQRVDSVRAGDSFAELSWGDLPARDSFLVEYQTAGFEIGTGFLLKTDVPRARLEGLRPNTAYEFYLATLCAGGDTSMLAGPFSFSTRFSRDVGISGVDLPPSDCDQDNTSLTFQVQVANFGLTPQSLLRLAFSVDGNEAAIDYPRDGVYTGIVGTGQSDEFRFDARVNATRGPGDYEIKAWTFLEEDQNTSNDTFTYIYTLQPLIDTFPYREDFESGQRILGIEPGSQNPSWQLGSPTGPAILKVPSGRNAWFSSRSSDAPSFPGRNAEQEISYLRFPCLNLGEQTEDPVFSFRLRMANENPDEFQAAWIEYSLDEGNSWVVLGDIGTGLNWYNGTPLDAAAPRWSANFNGLELDANWKAVAHPLTGLAGESSVKLRLGYRVTEHAGASEILVDDVQIFTSEAIDLMASGLNFIRSEYICQEDSIEQTVSFDFGNVGTTPQADISVGYTVNDGDPTRVPWSGISLDPNTEARELLPIRFPNEPGRYEVRLWVEVADDANPSNDTATLVLEIPSFGVPYQEDFETIETGGHPLAWTLPGDFAAVQRDESGNKVLTYQPQTPATGTIDFTTPRIGPLGVDDTLFFDYALPFALPGDLLMQVLASTDCFDTFLLLEELDPSELNNESALNRLSASLASLSGEQVQIRIRLTAAAFPTSTVFSLDNFRIQGCQADFETQVSVTNASAFDAADGSITVTPTTGIPPYTYQWSNGETTATVENLLPGTYRVAVSDTSGCTQSITAVVDFATSLVETAGLLSELSLAPNPSSGFTRLSARFRKAVEASWQLFNMTGQQVRQSSRAIFTQDLQEDLDLTGLPEGVYFLRLRAGDEWQSLKLVKSGR